MRVSRFQREDVHRHGQNLRGPDYLPSQATGERADGHLRQDARHDPLAADLASLDEVQRDRRGHPEHRVEPVDRIVHEASLPAVLLTGTRVPRQPPHDTVRHVSRWPDIRGSRPKGARVTPDRPDPDVARRDQP